MQQNLRINYSLEHNPLNVYTIDVTPNATVGELLQFVNRRENQQFHFIWLDDRILHETDMIINSYSPSKTYILTIEALSPSQRYADFLKSSKGFDSMNGSTFYNLSSQGDQYMPYFDNSSSSENNNFSNLNHQKYQNSNFNQPINPLLSNSGINSPNSDLNYSNSQSNQSNGNVFFENAESNNLKNNPAFNSDLIDFSVHNPNTQNIGANNNQRQNINPLFSNQNPLNAQYNQQFLPDQKLNNSNHLNQQYNTYKNQNHSQNPFINQQNSNGSFTNNQLMQNQYSNSQFNNQNSSYIQNPNSVNSFHSPNASLNPFYSQSKTQSSNFSPNNSSYSSNCNSSSHSKNNSMSGRQNPFFNNSNPLMSNIQTPSHQNPLLSQNPLFTNSNSQNPSSNIVNSASVNSATVNNGSMFQGGNDFQMNPGSNLNYNGMLMNPLHSNKSIYEEPQMAPFIMDGVPNNPFKSDIRFDPNEAKIFASDCNRPKPKSGCFLVYSTITPQSMLEGDNIPLNLSMTYEEVIKVIDPIIRSKKSLPSDIMYHIYLPCGLIFLGGCLSDFFKNESMKGAEQVLYVIVTKTFTQSELDSEYPELCNVADPFRKKLMSPLYDSSLPGLTHMACLLGYLNHDGIKADLLTKCLATVTLFAPLITSLNRMMERLHVTGRSIIAVTSSLHTYFTYLLPASVQSYNVFEYGLRCCNLISHIPEPPGHLPIQLITWKENGTSDFDNLCRLTKQQGSVYLWKYDIGESFRARKMEKPPDQAVENAFSMIASFRPIHPLSIRMATGCAIVWGTEGKTLLYLMESASKDRMKQNFIDLIDPVTGFTESVDIEVLAKALGGSSDSTAQLIDPERVRQLIQVCFDESYSMAGDLPHDRVIQPGSPTPSRCTIARQYLTLLANRVYGYRIPCIMGLLSFNDDITIRSPLSPLVPDFEDGIAKVNPKGQTHLWDALSRACDLLVEFNQDPEHSGEKLYKSAYSRIIVISDGEDINSETTPIDVCQKLVSNNIIVDAVIISLEDLCKPLCAICHLTGGLAFRPKTISEGLSLFEKNAFLDIEERRFSKKPVPPMTDISRYLPTHILPQDITEEVLNKVIEAVTYDTEVPDKNLDNYNTRNSLCPPRHMIYINHANQIGEPRRRRILRELHNASAICDPSNEASYNPDISIYTYMGALDRWRVFIRGSLGTQYGGKWWCINVTFPPLYPVEPPVFRFVSIPYHLNVSSEGRICLNVIERGYMSSKSVVEIIQEIQELFLMPAEDTPIQIEILDLYKHNKAEYDRRAKLSAERYAKNSVDEWIKSDTITDNSPAEFKVEVIRDKIPPHLRSQISGKPISDKVLASSGVFYDREELKQLITSSRLPICVITGKPLTETIQQIDDYNAK
ncbi:hypothetical protein TRFO_41941 [Tritrichomonas foetus]|uniref:UBC core domain-containing protein n=1 Tax=Tritrichomonas foetus TaxID=1144522 RepID=A0A1J4KYA8_9EUKA|nr:hypothetical protein TRFO_41941 [Tritrichomonas foetus]|eukprot:OHT16241.1 hypothetical protein TRFO_41941 [Tritrichomonas foetus]